MVQINHEKYDAAQAYSGDDFPRMPAGGYVARIQAVRTSGKDTKGNTIDYINDKQYVKLIYDIAEGEFAGRYSDEYWAGEDRDYGHCIYLSWKNEGALKGNINSLDESNPGFDALAALEADKWELFIGKLVGIVLAEEEYIGNNGEVKTRFKLPSLRSAQAIREGRFCVPELDKLPESERREAEQQPDNYDDVPFM